MPDHRFCILLKIRLSGRGTVYYGRSDCLDEVRCAREDLIGRITRKVNFSKFNKLPKTYHPRKKRRVFSPILTGHGRKLAVIYENELLSEFHDQTRAENKTAIARLTTSSYHRYGSNGHGKGNWHKATKGSSTHSKPNREENKSVDKISKVKKVKPRPRAIQIFTKEYPVYQYSSRRDVYNVAVREKTMAGNHKANKELWWKDINEPIENIIELIQQKLKAS
ncbi:hypothetical protein AC249_AIPGENE25314 [Exaiptasia diaphana]|nr:hypothetical protein AC249_AIPGENE25314 [Exaiptasia diaphana]